MIDAGEEIEGKRVRANTSDGDLLDLSPDEAFVTNRRADATGTVEEYVPRSFNLLYVVRYDDGTRAVHTLAELTLI